MTKENLLNEKIKNLSIEDEFYKKFEKAYKYAEEMTKRETEQSVEGLFHNLNTLQFTYKLAA